MIGLKQLLVLLAVLIPGTASAAGNLALASTVFVEKAISDRDGRVRMVLSEPKTVVPGDRLVFILNYRNTSAATASHFVVTNPLPEAVSYQGTPDQRALVSIDGGRVWGNLAALKVVERDGTVRGARPEDVTHIKWTLNQPVPAGAKGILSFRGIVR